MHAETPALRAATSGNTYGEGTTPADQTAYYKLVYSYTESSIDTGDVLKGVAFWRWDAIDTGSSLSALDAALSLSEPPTCCMSPACALRAALALTMQPMSPMELCM